jgi:hypothetical protein
MHAYLSAKFLLLASCLLIALLSQQTFAITDAPLVLTDDQQTSAIELAPHWQVFDDNLGDTDALLELALKPNTSLTYQTPASLSLSAQQPDQWLRLNLRAEKSSDNWFLNISPGELSRITLYFYDQHQQSNLQTSGRVYPQQIANPLLQQSGGYLLPLPIQQGDQSFLLHLHHPAATPIDLQLISQSGIAAQRAWRSELNGLFVGSLCGLLLLAIYVGWQQKFKAYFGLALANVGWILAWIAEQKIGALSIWLAPITRTSTLSHVVIGVAWSLYLHLMLQALAIEVNYPRWHRYFLITVAVVFLGSLSLPLWPTFTFNSFALPTIVSASALWVMITSYGCRQAHFIHRVLIMAICSSAIIAVNLDLLLIHLPVMLLSSWPHHWLHLASIGLLMVMGHSLLQHQQAHQQRQEQQHQHKHQKQLALQLRQSQWHNRLHNQCLQQIQTTVGKLIPALSNNPALVRVHHALQRVQALAADGPVQDMPFLLKPLLMGLAKECLEHCKSKSLKFHVAFDKKLPVAVRGDARLLHRLLHELLLNAVHYTPQGDVIFKVSTTQLPSTQNHDAVFKIDFLIQDTGSGLPAEHENPVLMMKKTHAAKAVPSKTADTSGETSLAMGLVICRHLVQLLQGSLQVKSVSGQGTRFMVRFNLTAADPQYASTDPLNDNIMPLRIHAPTKAGLELALIVDDNPIVQQSVAAILKKLGYKPLIASGGEAAIDILALNAIDIIFMDCEMPQMNGFETLTALRAMPNHQRVPVIAISSYPQAEFRSKALAGGFTDYIEKPITREKISELLHSMHLEMPTTADDLQN